MKATAGKIPRGYAGKGKQTLEHMYTLSKNNYVGQQIKKKKKTSAPSSNIAAFISSPHTSLCLLFTKGRYLIVTD